jgi:stress responsive alpha/beta barrel protein
MTLQHVVLFALPKQDPGEEARLLESAVSSWPGQIPNVRCLRLGRDLTGARSRGYDYLMYMEFEDAADLRSYQEHPAHVRFTEWLRAVGCQVLVMDYVLDESTVLR